VAPPDPSVGNKRLAQDDKSTKSTVDEDFSSMAARLR
jgi:hypothetical protein